MRKRLLACAWVALTCCSRIETKDAVRDGVLDYLTKRANINVTLMDVDITSVAFRGNEADAVVAFRGKGENSEGIRMRYTLEKKGGHWEVKNRTEAGNPHQLGGKGGKQGTGSIPPGHPAVPNR